MSTHITDYHNQKLEMLAKHLGVLNDSRNLIHVVGDVYRAYEALWLILYNPMKCRYDFKLLYPVRVFENEVIEKDPLRKL